MGMFPLAPGRPTHTCLGCGTKLAADFAYGEWMTNDISMCAGGGVCVPIPVDDVEQLQAGHELDDANKMTSEEERG